MALIQWNCRGALGNFLELKQLLADIQPACVALQETFLSTVDKFSLRGFSVHHKNRPGARVCGGFALLVSTSFPTLPVPLTTCLEAVAVRVAFPCLVTVCSLYLPDSVPVRVPLLTRLVSQLPPPLLLGDFNSHNPLWGSSRLDARGHLVESFLTGADLLFLNTGLPTHFASHFRTFSHIDLSICSSLLFPLLEWSLADSLHDSDHYPLILHLSPSEASLGSRHPHWITIWADWPAFQEACTATFPSIASLDVDSAVDCLTSTLVAAATVSIPRSSEHLPLHPKPWWNADCKVTHSAQK